MNKITPERLSKIESRISLDDIGREHTQLKMAAFRAKSAIELFSNPPMMLHGMDGCFIPSTSAARICDWLSLGACGMYDDNLAANSEPAKRFWDDGDHAGVDREDVADMIAEIRRCWKLLDDD